MLSILIPTYNYNVYALVHAVQKQAKSCNISFEIKVYDDCSTHPVKENQAINSIANASYSSLAENIGRSAIRNKLAKDASYDTLLFLDADTKIVRKDFIKTYLKALNDNSQIIYGGICYQKETPPKAQVLRWHYGNNREALSVIERKKAPYLRFLTLNFLIKKTVFELLCFNEDIPNLRHEDTLFALDAKKKNIHISHIDNTVIHLGIENSELFLKKSVESVEALAQLIDQGLIDASETALSKKAKQLEQNGSAAFLRTGISLGTALMKKNLLSNTPSLFIFDLYRLGHYLQCVKKTQKSFF